MSGVAKLLGGGDKPKPTPLVKLPEPKNVPIPSPQGVAPLEAARRARLAASKRAGRASTILTDTTSAVPPAYSNTFLGE
jgi:hypothetical protein